MRQQSDFDHLDSFAVEKYNFSFQTRPKFIAGVFFDCVRNNNAPSEARCSEMVNWGQCDQMLEWKVAQIFQ